MELAGLAAAAGLAGRGFALLVVWSARDAQCCGWELLSGWVMGLAGLVVAGVDGVVWPARRTMSFE